MELTCPQLRTGLTAKLISILLGARNWSRQCLLITVEVTFEISSSVPVSLFLASPPLSKVRVDRSDMLMTYCTRFSG